MEERGAASLFRNADSGVRLFTYWLYLLTFDPEEYGLMLSFYAYGKKKRGGAKSDGAYMPYF